MEVMALWTRSGPPLWLGAYTTTGTAALVHRGHHNGISWLDAGSLRHSVRCSTSKGKISKYNFLRQNVKALPIMWSTFGRRAPAGTRYPAEHFLSALLVDLRTAAKEVYAKTIDC
ncbi:hypothetical protein EDB19DRAFT_1730789 [Suillus lakei]|nr:hypothetical protein EDB19DRAFT_1730789 [Suillus lakei]